MSTNINFVNSLGLGSNTRVDFNLPRTILLKGEGRAVASSLGVAEAELCSYNTLNGLNYLALLRSASLIVTPNSYNEGTLFSVIPLNGNGDFTVTRATKARRTNSIGLIESVANNVPRLDYSLGSCPNLLLEPQRTNLALQSSSFDSATWVKDAGVIVDANTTTSPSGVQDADRINFTINNIAIYRAGTSTGAHMFSIYLKGEGANIGKQIQLIIGNVGGTTNVTLTDQWQRFTADATSSTYVGITKVSSGQADSVLAWGAQLEAGAYATSYIPTTTASVTRNADQITLGNVYTNGLISASGGTWFVELRNNISRTRDASNVGFGVGSSSALDVNALYIRQEFPTSRNSIMKRVSGSNTTLFTTSTDTAKIAIKWNGTTADVFVNGVKQVSATAFTATTLEWLVAFSTDVPKYIPQMALYTTPLTDPELISLTTL